INCPTCRIIESTSPVNSLKDIKTPAFKIESPIFKKENRLKDKLIEEVITKKISATQPPLNSITKPIFINEAPNFANRLFQERANELDISKDDNFGISKKIPLESPEWQFEEEE
ncbi:MAG: hypothetical protein ACW972_02605, partial [Promethearchaeota archaeon]